MMEAVRTSETSVDNHFTRQYNPEDSSEQLTMTFGRFVIAFNSDIFQKQTRICMWCTHATSDTKNHMIGFSDAILFREQ
jgi:hypothetical protein